MVKKISILGTNVSVVNWGNVIAKIEELLKKKNQIFITTPNPEHIVEAWENNEFQSLINNSDLAVPDGIGLVWALKLKIKNKKLKIEEKEIERVTGIDLMEKLCEMAQDNKWKVGLLGGTGNVGLDTKKILEKKYKGLEVDYVGSHKNVLNRNENEDKEIIQIIKSRNIKVLFVAYGAFKQELIISEYIKLVPEVKIFMGVGGAFDFVSGELKRAPKWVQIIGFEWIFRLFQEPWRWKRQLRLVKFVWLVNRNKK